MYNANQNGNTAQRKENILKKTFTIALRLQSVFQLLEASA